ncbi:LacI family DNA-binding transcriptional regulator, partial [Micromonospora sp. NPDC050397]|uniref:LacI family DNA-binding transcriptional regulator n=1 Tax=Micromonospora sp. NPDC050397 TaxID=3364279 RepID=UPI00384F7BDB
VIAGPKHLTTTTDRLTGLRHAARDHGHKLPTRHITYANFDRDSGATATATLLDTQPHLTAIAALNDTMAIGALALLRSRGIKVPQQISVTGFDDMPIARDVTPTLTTVRLPLADMGARAMTLALGEPGPHQVEQVPAELIRRDSSAPPPGRS